jgi:hypothetical protein
MAGAGMQGIAPRGRPGGGCSRARGAARRETGDRLPPGARP